MSKMWKPLKELLPNKKSNLANLTSVSKSNMELVNKFNNYFTKAKKKKYVVLLSQQPTLAKNKNKKSQSETHSTLFRLDVS